jgi:hypothetical protein
MLQRRPALGNVMQQSLTATYALNSWGTVQDNVFPLINNKVIYTEPVNYDKVHIITAQNLIMCLWQHSQEETKQE